MISVGIIGAGLIGTKRAQAMLELRTLFTVGTVYDVAANRAERLAESLQCEVSDSIEKILDNPGIDAVIIATPNKFIKDIAVAALGRGKHVLCEKPLGRNAAEAEEIASQAASRGLVLKTGFNHRHHPAIQQAKKLVDSGRIGRAYFARAVYGHGGRPGYEKEWRASRDQCGGGELLDQGVHIIDLFRWFLGEFDEVFGKVETFYWDMEVEDNAFAMFRTHGGQVATMHTSWTQWKNKFLLEVIGEKGYVIVDGLGGSYGTERLVIGKRKVLDSNERDLPSGIQYIGGVPDEEIIEFPGPDISWREELKEFASAIAENREPLGSGYDGVMANRLIGAVYESARRNIPVRLGPFERGS